MARFYLVAGGVATSFYYSNVDEHDEHGHQLHDSKHDKRGGEAACHLKEPSCGVHKRKRYFVDLRTLLRQSPTRSSLSGYAVNVTSFILSLKNILTVV